MNPYEKFVFLKACVTGVVNQPWRTYHNMEHLERMHIFYLKHLWRVTEEVMLAIAFHDYWYYPGCRQNEENSAQEFLKFLTMDERGKEFAGVDAQKVVDLILATKDPYNPKLTEDQKHFVEADWNGMMSWSTLTQERINFLDAWEDGIFKECQMFPIQSYLFGREAFLKHARKQNFLKNNIYEYMMHRLNTKTYRAGIYAGTFCPFHCGHLAVLEEAVHQFDKVVIVAAHNSQKSVMLRSNIFKMFPYMETKLLKPGEMMVDYLKTFCGNKNVQFTMIRGMRNSFDFEYEKNVQDTITDNANVANERVQGGLFDERTPVHVINILARRDARHISSSMIEGLANVYKTPYILPNPVCGFNADGSAHFAEAKFVPEYDPYK